jgi:hypothetical protein
VLQSVALEAVYVVITTILAVGDRMVARAQGKKLEASNTEVGVEG